MGEDDSGTRSLFAVLGYSYVSCYFCSIVQLNQPPEDIEIVDAKYFAHFKYTPPPERPYILWSFVPSSTNDFYMVPYSEGLGNRPLHGATFNFSTKTFQLMKPNKSSKLERIAVNVGQDVYFLAHPNKYYEDADAAAPDETAFECHIPAEERWDKEAPFPYDGYQHLGHKAHIEAKVVWGDIIILNMGGHQIWAYHVSKRKWYRVLVGDEKEGDFKVAVGNDGKNNYLCYAIIGEGFVVKNTLYALSNLSFSSVLALSIEKKEVAGGDLQFGCSLRSQIVVPFLTPIEDAGACFRTRDFVHLGGDNFCLVQSCQSWVQSVYQQPIEVTYMKLVGEDEMVVTNILRHRLRTPKDQLHGQFHVVSCFSQPECKTTALKQGETTFIFDPYDGFAAEEDRTDRLREPEVGELFREEKNASLGKDGPLLIDDELTSVLKKKKKKKKKEKKKQNTISAGSDENKREGYSVMVVNLPFGATAEPIEKEVKKFGPIKRNGIRVNNMSDKKEKYCFAVVEFESVAAKGHAIKASPIIIGGCQVDIVDKRITSLA